MDVSLMVEYVLDNENINLFPSKNEIKEKKPRLRKQSDNYRTES